MLKYFFLTFLILISFTTKAFAYLDPAFFSTIFNFFIALIAAIAAYASLFWSKIKNFFNMKRKNTKNDKKET